MAQNDHTTVTVERGTWKRLNARKEPSDSFDDVLNRLLDETEESKDSVDMEVSA